MNGIMLALSKYTTIKNNDVFNLNSVSHVMRINVEKIMSNESIIFVAIGDPWKKIHAGSEY